MTAVLRFARSQSWEPGSNLAGEQVDTTWMFVLPSLDLGDVSVVGKPDAGTLVALRAQARSVREGLDGDLVYVAGPVDPAALRVAVGRGAVVYVEPGCAERVEADVTVEIGPDGGAPATAAPGIAAWLIPAPPPPPSTAARIVRRIVRTVRRTPYIPGAGRLGVTAVRPGPVEIAGRGALLRADGDVPARPPAWLREAAGLDEATWTIAPPRGYRSQKVVFFVRPAGGDEFIVKVTQDPVFNERLANEHAALEALDVPAGLAPRALFRAEHAGLLVVGESLLDGGSFREHADGSPGSPVAAAVLDALVTLGTSAAPGAIGPELAGALTELLDRHRHVHAPPAEQVRRLQRQIAVLRDGDVPRAFLHGDPSTLNVLVRDDGGIGLVDWENAEPAGPPVWDLVYFCATYANWNAELAGRRSGAGLALQRLTQPGPFRDLLHGAIGSFRERRPLSDEVTDALFETFWLWMALREGMRLSAEAAPGGPYARALASLTARS